MARPAAEHPTELELQILHVLWQEAPLPVREIRKRLAAAGRSLAHTSVITVLNIMVGKGFVKRAPQGNAYLFAPRVRRQGLSRRMMQSLVDRVFGGSTLAVVQQLLDTDDLDAEELAQIKQLINRKAKEQS
jgi:BlaI family penicillinase repressor